LFVTTSNRSPYVAKQGERAKSSQLADHLAYLLRQKGCDVEVIDASSLTIHNCLGCVSELHGNQCGAKASKVKDEKKNPTGHLRCWASHDFEDDELWKIVNPLYESDAVVFFASQRWGSANAIYQKLIERLDWIENMHTSLGEENSVKDIQAGLVIIGQNWKVEESLLTQKKVLEFYGFKTPDSLFIGWQYTRDSNDETQESYRNAVDTFEQAWNIKLFNWEKPKGTELSIEKSNESHFVTFKDFLNEIKNL
jgi:multimeric flavodoxin WrbA